MVGGEWRVEEQADRAIQPSSAVVAKDDAVALSAQLAIHNSSLSLSADIFPSGLNGALRRWANIETKSLPLFDKRAG